MAASLKVNLQSLNKDMTFASKGTSGHWHMIDTHEDNGGNGAAASPMEMLLEALGGCSGMDTLAILRKKRTPFSRLEIRIEGERRDEHPKIFTNIHMLFILYSDHGEKALRDLQRATELSIEKYCSVSAMLSSTVNITHEAQIASE